MIVKAIENVNMGEQDEHSTEALKLSSLVTHISLKSNERRN